MRKILTFVAAILLSLSLADTIYADEITDSDLQKAEITYQDDEITVGRWGNDPEILKKIEESPTSVTVTEESSLIQPAKTVIGPGGKVTIDAASNGRRIYWTVKPNTSWPWWFIGEIRLRYYSGYKRNQHIEGVGALGGSDGGYISMNKNNGGIATLKGTAYSMNNSKFTVMPGASVPFGKGR